MPQPLRSTAAAATASVAVHLETEIAPLLVEAREHPANPVELPPVIESSPLQASERTVTIEDGDWRWVITLGTSVDPARDEWVFSVDKKNLIGKVDFFIKNFNNQIISKKFENNDLDYTIKWSEALKNHLSKKNKIVFYKKKDNSRANCSPFFLPFYKK